eukprot:CAMPEP_0202106374 /NCGR_PEP_ID=MMETSP0965-20130614/9383_1 /ASSEMBLY_ACC=CAM_ASM_000507 /TAXON_ID=4773 /ORGANISM="Schizochytrium aggregatum, Strain ATCC28209" /LENGTH=263 /DNA_ID=CAMNT_0048675361 /DNA_START=40 /DNA_END=828 /DNA_ORIENTATION=-
MRVYITRGKGKPREHARARASRGAQLQPRSSAVSLPLPVTLRHRIAALLSGLELHGLLAGADLAAAKVIPLQVIEIVALVARVAGEGVLPRARGGRGRLGLGWAGAAQLRFPRDRGPLVGHRLAVPHDRLVDLALEGAVAPEAAVAHRHSGEVVVAVHEGLVGFVVVALVIGAEHCERIAAGLFGRAFLLENHHGRRDRDRRPERLPGPRVGRRPRPVLAQHAAEEAAAGLRQGSLARAEGPDARAADRAAARGAQAAVARGA